MLKSKNLKKIAVCGRFASGKTTACQILAKFGAYVINADKIVHELLASDPIVKRKVVDIFGKNVLAGNEIDRKKVAEIVFNDKESLIQLEAILHPLVIKEIKERYKLVKNNSQYKAFVAELPVLDKLKISDWFDEVILLTSHENIAIERAKKLGVDQAQYNLRVASQSTDCELKNLATIFVNNQGSYDQLENQLKQLL